MSLTTELHTPNSVLARWCAEVFVRTDAVVEQVCAAARDVRPVRPQARQVPGRHWAEIGGAFGRRLADLVQPAPPYYALSGILRARWGSPAWAHQQAAQYPTHRGLPAEYQGRALHLRPAVGTWLDLSGLAEPDEPLPAAAATWTDLLGRTRAYLARHAPVGALGTPGVEAGLARSAWLLSVCEGIRRSGMVDDRLARMFDTTTPSTEQLRGLVDAHQVAELVELAARLQSSGALWEFRKLAGSPTAGQALGIAGPTIVPTWAEGDVLLGADPDSAAGATLIDVKTVISLRDPQKVARWIWQVLLYAWLDTADVYRVRTVGLFLARHGVLLTWPVPQLVAELLGRADTGDRYRDQARAIAGQLIADAGLQWPIVWPGNHRVPLR